MRKRKIAPFLNKQYKKLEKREKYTKKRLLLIDTMLADTIDAIVRDAYLYCTVNGEIDYSRLLHTINRVEATIIKTKVNAVYTLYQKELKKEQFPFSVLKFDQLNRLDYYRADMMCTCITTVFEQRKELRRHYSDFLSVMLPELAEYIAISPITVSTITKPLVTKNETITQSLYNSMTGTANGSVSRLQTALMRGDDYDKASQIVAEYVVRKAKQDSERLLYTEGTHITNEAVKMVVEEYAAYFYSVPVLDDKTCQNCIDIALQQQKKPVPIALFRVGITAPPFHPWCRCMFEVIWNGKGKENRE